MITYIISKTNDRNALQDLIILHICRFNGKDFLKRFKGKKIMFVGDSLSENQWESLICMVHAAIPQAQFSKIYKGNLITITWPVSS